MDLLEAYCERVRELPEDQIPAFCKEIRRFLVRKVSDTGGHLASNLGVVELTVALHRVLDTRHDRLVFDVGHQCYVHKLLTHRRQSFGGLRTLGGMAGFPKPAESRHDAFVAGHASTSVSATLGLARARTLTGGTHHCVALLGDGALTGGMVYEALNDAGQSKEPMIVILNDNKMSITKNVGSIAGHLSRLRLKPQYFRLKRAYHRILDPVPGGKVIDTVLNKGKNSLKKLFIPGTFFEQMGFVYLGPTDGHDVAGLTELLREALAMAKPVLIHAVTKKGKGYRYSEKNPRAFHGVGRFQVRTGRSTDEKAGSTFSDVFGAQLCELAGKDQRICAITAAMTDGTGLGNFAARFPKRFFDVGIAEEHAVTMAAGMAAGGLRPVVAIYSTFLQRAYDQIIHDVAISGLPVVFIADRAGLSGEDGETHHGVYDPLFLGSIPGIELYAPANFAELRALMRLALLANTPTAIRMPRGGEGRCRNCHLQPTALTSGLDATVICYGHMVEEALEASRRFAAVGFGLRVLKLTALKPLDKELVLSLCRGVVFLLEDSRSGMEDSFGAVPIHPGDHFVGHGSVGELRRMLGIDADGVVKAVSAALGLSRPGA